MTFPFQRIFRLLVSQQTPGEVFSGPLPAVMSDENETEVAQSTTSPMTETVVESSVSAAEIAEAVEERPFHVFEAPLSGDGALIFVLPPNRPESDDVKLAQRHLRRQKDKAREVSRREARRAKQSWQSAAVQ